MAAERQTQARPRRKRPVAKEKQAPEPEEQLALPVVGSARAGGNPVIPLDDYVAYFNYAGLSYPFLQRSTLGQREEWPDPTFEGRVQAFFRSNPVIFACELRRMQLFADLRFQFQRMRAGKAGDLFGSVQLAVLEKPWPGGTTADLAARVLLDADMEGSSYTVLRGGRLIRLRPDWVTIVAGSNSNPDMRIWDVNSELLGYIYQPGGPGGFGEPEFFLPEEVCHFAPVPDPSFRFRGVSWMLPVLLETLGDRAASLHKYQYFVHGATPNLVVTMDPRVTKEKFDQWVERMDTQHAGVMNAYKTLYLGGGASAQVVGANLQQVDFKVTQGAGETRIAAAAGVPPVLAGLSEGLAAATYSNYNQARRSMGDMTVLPLWRNFCGSLETIINVPSDARLWYDTRDVPWLREDAAEAANIAKVEASTIQELIIAGYKPDSVIDAVVNHDWTRLQHTGLYSVQLQPPQTNVPQLITGPPNGKPVPAQPSNGQPPANVPAPGG